LQFSARLSLDVNCEVSYVINSQQHVNKFNVGQLVSSFYFFCLFFFLAYSVQAYRVQKIISSLFWCADVAFFTISTRHCGWR